MKQNIILTATLANCSSEATSDDLLGFMKNQTSDVDYYKFIPKPGVVYNNSLDWHAVLNDAANVLQIAAILWGAYKVLVQPLRDKGKDNAFLFLQVENENGDRTQFIVGKEFDEEATFTSEFSKRVEKIRIAPDGGIEIEREETSSSTHWKRI